MKERDKQWMIHYIEQAENEVLNAQNEIYARLNNCDPTSKEWESLDKSISHLRDAVDKIQDAFICIERTLFFDTQRPAETTRVSDPDWNVVR